MQGMHKLGRFISISAALLWSGAARADETPLVYPLDLEHSACPEEAFVAATEDFSVAQRRFTTPRMLVARPRVEGILSMQESEDRPLRRAFRGPRLRNVEARDESPVQRAPRAWRAESRLEEVEGGFFPLLPYFQAAGDHERDGAVELAGFLADEPSTCPAEEMPIDCDEECPNTLPDEAAREILALRKRLGPALRGTAFDADACELAADPDQVASRAGAVRYLVEYIRLLERQENEQPPAPELFEIALEPRVTHAFEGNACATPEARDALRAASERLDEAANLLERQELFARADELRSMADSMRKQARGAVAAAPRCGGRVMRPTVRSPQMCPGSEEGQVHEGCPANIEHQSITWIPRDEDAVAIQTFEPENWAGAKGTRPNPPAEHSGPWWNCWYPMSGPCGASSGIRIGMPPGMTARDAIRFPPRETMERLPPIVEGRTPDSPRGIPARSSFDAISETLQMEKEMEMARALRAQRIQDRIESEILFREIEELGQLTEEAARQERAGRRPAGRFDPSELRREVSRLKRQLESNYR